MAIPKYHQIYKPILKLLSAQERYTLREFEPKLAPVFELSDEEIEKEYESGNGRIFPDRISWALTHMIIAGLIDRPQRGVYTIKEAGKSLLNSSPSEIRDYVNDKRIEYDRSKRAKTKTEKKEPKVNTADATPEEVLSDSFQELKSAMNQEILDTILSKHPQAFEKIVVELLQKMGYGGALKDSGEVTQYSNDGGIDGIIKEDVLGFGRIHLQAKRYAPENKIGRVDIQSFVGAMAAAKADKGIFITTSSFTREAHEYVKSLSNAMRLLLMDGEELANHIYDFGLGMSVDRVIEIKKLDSDYWDSLISDT